MPYSTSKTHKLPRQDQTCRGETAEEKWEEKCLLWKHARIIADESLGSGEQGAVQAEVKDRAGTAVGLGGGVAEGWAGGEQRGLERGLMGNTATAQSEGAARQQWPDTAEGLRGVPGLLEQDKGLFGESILSMVRWATAQAWASIKDRKYDVEVGAH